MAQSRYLAGLDAENKFMLAQVSVVALGTPDRQAGRMSQRTNV